MMGRIWASLFGPSTDLTPMPKKELDDLTSAIKDLKVEQVSALVQTARSHNYDLNTYTKYNFTPLHYALTRSRRSKYSHTDDAILAIVKLLHENGADINKVSNERLATSPLHTACRRGAPEFVEWLLSKGADPQIKDSTQKTPLDYINSVILARKTDNMSSIEDIYYMLKQGNIESTEGSDNRMNQGSSH